jgi:hypothetical protein
MRSGSITAKNKFSRKLLRKFCIFAKIFSQKRKLNFAKKTKSKTFVPTLFKFVAKPHHFHAAPTPSQYFSNTNKQNLPLSDFCPLS